MTRVPRPSARHAAVVAAASGAFFVLAGLMASSCPNMMPTPQAGVTDVKMQNMAFVPQNVTIKQGESVRWTNMDLVPHTATSGSPGDANAGSLWNSGNLSMGQSYTHKFNDVGEFVYFCQVHPTMMFGAKVTVTAP